MLKFDIKQITLISCPYFKKMSPFLHDNFLPLTLQEMFWTEVHYQFAAWQNSLNSDVCMDRNRI